MAKLKQLSEQEMFVSKKRFNKLLEYSFVNQADDLLLDEDDDPNDPNQNPGMPTPNSNDNVPAVGMPSPDNAPDSTPMNSNGSMPDSGEPQIDTNPNPDAQLGGEANPELGGELKNEPAPIEPAENEVEIDVTDLTSKQDDVDAKVTAMAAQNQQMMDVLSQLADKVGGIVKNSEVEMAKLKDEIIKRNPTPVETLQKRITVSDPFTVTPADYWKNKEAEGHYRLSDDDNADNKEEYVINNSDINNGNAQEIYKSFGLDDDEMNQSLATMFKI